MSLTLDDQVVQWIAIALMVTVLAKAAASLWRCRH